MEILPQHIRELIQELTRLPGVGTKTAQRLAFYLLRSHKSLHTSLGSALLKLKENIMLCERCSNITENSPCVICSDFKRDHSTVCVVEEALDAIALENTHEYSGVYHVLHGVLSPLDGVGPDDITIFQLKKRIEDGLSERSPRIQEIILATNPTVTGDATALFIQKLLEPFQLTITRIACGIPTGGDLQYADSSTLKNALSHRKPY